MPSKKINFTNQNGYNLSAKLELPMLPEPIGYAIFAHVFTGNKNIKSARVISRALNLEGFAVLRFDFTGLGESEGDFADSNFTSNVEDLIAAAAYLDMNYEAPSLIVGHSLGGSASIFAGAQIPSIQAIATIGSPSDPAHVTHLLHKQLETIHEKGSAKVNIDGRIFTIKKQFLEDLQSKRLDEVLASMDKALLVLHSPQDRVVEIENAAQIYHHAKHPKSFVTLNGANHMLTNKDDAFYTGSVIASWAKRYVPYKEEKKLSTKKNVVARITKYAITTEVLAGKHGFLADESEDLGGFDFGPSPYELLTSSLASSTAMALQYFAKTHNIPLEEIQVHISYDNEYDDDSEALHDENARLLTMERHILIESNQKDLNLSIILKAADNCPVFRSLQKAIHIKSTVEYLR